MIIQPLSDLHGFLPDIPRCDLLLIAGDVCPQDDHSVEYQMGWISGTFGPWLQSLPSREIIWIAGNHDFATEDSDFRALANTLPGVYLQDEGTSFEGLRIWGSPWINTVGYGMEWAWETDEAGMKKTFQQMPEETDILIAHSPPYGYGDRCQDGRRVGSENMAKEVLRASPSLLVCGHIHEDPGVRTMEETTVFSYPQMDEIFAPRAELPPQLDLDTKTKNIEIIS